MGFCFCLGKLSEPLVTSQRANFQGCVSEHKHFLKCRATIFLGPFFFFYQIWNPSQLFLNSFCPKCGLFARNLIKIWSWLLFTVHLALLMFSPKVFIYSKHEWGIFSQLHQGTCGSAVTESCVAVFFHQVIQFVLHKHTTSLPTRLFYEPVCIYMEAKTVWVREQAENIQSIKLISKKHTQFQRF